MVDLDATYRWCLTGWALCQFKFSFLSNLLSSQHTDHQHTLRRLWVDSLLAAEAVERLEPIQRADRTE